MATQPNHLERYAGRDQALADLEWEQSPEAWAARQAKGVAAGFVNPFGLAGWGARGLARVAPSILSPETARNVQDTLNRWDEEAPVAATVGTFMMPGYGLLRTAGRLGHREAMRMLPHVSGIGGGVGSIRNLLANPETVRETRQRAREYGAAGY